MSRLRKHISTSSAWADEIIGVFKMNNTTDASNACLLETEQHWHM
jgi:hypothetical protein